MAAATLSALDLFGDDFDDVVAAVFGRDGDAPVPEWLDAPVEVVPLPAAKQTVLSPGARPGAVAHKADPEKAAAASTHRCVNPEHSSPCPWCAKRARRGWLRVLRLAGSRPALTRAASRRRCTPAPSAEDELDYELVGDPGKARGGGGAARDATPDASPLPGPRTRRSALTRRPAPRRKTARRSCAAS